MGSIRIKMTLHVQKFLPPKIKTSHLWLKCWRCDEVISSTIKILQSIVQMVNKEKDSTGKSAILPLTWALTLICSFGTQMRHKYSCDCQ